MKTKVEGFDPNEGEEPEFTGSSIPWTRLFTPFATCGDYCLFALATLFATAFGASLPAFSLFFGAAVDDMGSADADYEALLAPALEEWMTINGVSETDIASYTEEQMAAAYADAVQYVVPDMSSLKGQAAIMFYIGCVLFVVAGGMMALWAMFAENIAYKTRIAYFRSSLEKDAAYYDENLPTAMASKISKETAAVQRGLGDKVSQVL